MGRLAVWAEKFARAFPLWVSLAGGLGLVHPPLLSWFIKAGLVTPALALVMLSMGMTLEPTDFRRVLARPRAVLLGVLLQFTVMPLLGFGVAAVFELPPGFAAGLILVACCPGGTASNVIAFLAKADVALSVSLTAVSTVVAAVATPALTTLLVGSRVEVDVISLYVTTAEVVVLPVAGGLLLRRWAPRLCASVLPMMPALAVLAIVLIVGGILAVQQGNVLSAGPRLLLSVITTHGLAFLIAYIVGGCVFGFGRVARTLSVEVGMQNSGLGVVLARASFSANPLVSVSPAISAVVHCLYGSALAAYWSRRQIDH